MNHWEVKNPLYMSWELEKFYNIINKGPNSGGRGHDIVYNARKIVQEVRIARFRGEIHKLLR